MTTKKWIIVLKSLPERDLNWQLTVYLSGDHNRKIRQEIMSEIKGVKVPIAKSGITAIQNAIMESELWKLGERLRTIGMEDGENYQVFEHPVWKEMKFRWERNLLGYCPHFEYNDNGFTYRLSFNLDKVTFKDRNNNIHNF